MKKYLALFVAPLALSACGVEVVDTGHRGVETRFGEVVSESLPEGLYFYNPFTSDIIEMDTRILKMEERTTAFTKDVQQASIDFGLNYHLVRDRVHEVYANVGKEWDSKLLPPIVYGQIKSVVGQWDAVELISNRNKATREIEEAIKASLAEQGVVVTKFEMTNIDYTDDFEQAVEEKVTAIQKAEAEKNRTVQVEETARQKVIAAKAEAESMRIRANALTQNKALVEWEAVQKWNGVLPQYVLGGNTTPFINLNK